MNRAILSLVRWEAGTVCCTDRPSIPMPAKVGGNLCNFFRFANSCVPRTRSKNMQKVLLLLLLFMEILMIYAFTPMDPHGIMRRVPSVCVNEIMAGLFLFIEAEHNKKTWEEVVHRSADSVVGAIIALIAFKERVKAVVAWIKSSRVKTKINNMMQYKKGVLRTTMTRFRVELGQTSYKIWIKLSINRNWPLGNYANWWGYTLYL